MVMNDGLGLMSVPLARSLAEALRLPDTPCAFQGRLGPAKGVWIIDINDNFYNNDLWIKTYPSQRKWECDFQDPHHRTFGVKNFSSEKCLKPTNLNLQFIPVLMYGAKHKGRMRHSIEQRLKTCLEQETSAEKDALDDPRRLLQLVYKAGPEKEITFKGGLPPGDEDRAFLMLVSGFTRENRFLNDLLWKLRQEKIAELKKRMKIQIPCSTYLYMVVDLWGILEPGEVHISFSNKFFAEGDESQGVPGFSDTMVDEMDVLVARSPAHLPSDIQRVRAVSHPKLRKLKDVIVFSVKGSRPLADYLSGGDYDGDQAWVCWDRDIVTNFENTRRDPPKCDFVDEGYLQKDRCTFKDLLCEHRGIVAYHEFLCRSLSFSMQQDMLGICTKHKEWTCYKLGVDHPATMRESVLLSDLVDQAKAGITFTREAWKAFKKSLEIPGILDQPEYEKEKASDKWLRDVNRRGKEPHVLDYLKFQVADRIIDATLREFHQALKNNPKPNAYDSDLTSLYDEFHQWAAHSNSGGRCMRYLESACRELEKLWDQGVASADVDFEDNVQRVHERFMAIEPPDKAASSRTFNCLNDAWMRCASIKDRPLLAHPGSVDWNDGNLSRWTLLKASTLFKICYKSKELMCWHVAGRQLMHIKASVVGGRSKDTIPILVVPDIFAVLRPDNRAIKRLAAAANQAAGEESVLALEEVNDLDEEGTVIDDV